MMKKLEGFQTTREQTSTESMTNGMTTFSAAEVADKYTNYIDGLKTIHRRILWCARSIYQKTTDPIPMAKMLGAIMEIHTSGDQSIYEALIRLSQPFKVGIPLIRVDGKNGAYYDPAGAAAYRYLQSSLSEFAYDVYFKDIDARTVPMVSTKDFTGVEPRYLIPKIPMTLVLYNLTIGVGFKSTTSMMDINSVCDLVIQYVTNQINGGNGDAPAKVYGKMIVPSFPIKTLITNKEELLEAYSNDNWEVPIRTEGVVEMSGDNITLRSVPYHVDFSDVTSKLRDKLKSKEGRYLLPYIKSLCSFSAAEAEYAIPLVKGKNPFVALDLIRPRLRLTEPIHPSFIFTNGNNKLVSMSPLKLLTAWYKERKASIIGSLKYKQAALLLKIREIEAILLIVDHTDEVISILRNAETEQECIRTLHLVFNTKYGIKLSQQQAIIIQRQQLNTLIKASKPKLLNELEITRRKYEDNYKKFSMVNQIIIDDAKLIKEKYGKKVPKLTRYSSEFKGCVQFGNWGIINFFDEEDMINILSSKGWGTIKRSIYFYNRNDDRFVVINGRLVPMVNPSREITCEGVVQCPSNGSGMSLVINKSGNTAIIERDIPDQAIAKAIPNDDTWSIFPISKNFYAIHRDGSVTKEVYTSYSIRKTVSCGAKSDIVYALPSNSRDMVVFHANPLEPNVIRVGRILSTDIGKLNAVVAGDMFILGVYNIKDKEICLNIPNECTKLVNIEFLIVKNIKNLFSENNMNNLLIDLNKTSNISKKLRRHPQIRTLYMLDL